MNTHDYHFISNINVGFHLGGGGGGGGGSAYLGNCIIKIIIGVDKCLTLDKVREQ